MEAKVDKKMRPHRRHRANQNYSEKAKKATIGPKAVELEDTDPAGDIEPKPKRSLNTRYRKRKDYSRGLEGKERELEHPDAGVERSQADAKPQKHSNRQRKHLEARTDHHSYWRAGQGHATAAEGSANKSLLNQNATSLRANQPGTAGSSGPKLKFVRPPKGLKTQRESKTSFLSLPAEIRNMIYELCIDLSGITQNVANEQQGYYDGMRFIDSQHQPKKIIKLMRRLARRHGNLRTANIFLINRQIYEEAEAILRKRTVVFTAPSIHDMTYLPLYQMISQYLMRKVRSIHIVMSMKQHTDESMAGELQIGSNWFCHHATDNKSLKDSLAWVYFLGDIITMLWVPGASVQHIVFFMKGGKAGDRSYILRPTQTILNGLDKMLMTCLKSRKLEHFLSYLEYAEAPSDL